MHKVLGSSPSITNDSGVVVHARNPNTQEAEAGRSDVQAYIHLHSSQGLPGIYETPSKEVGVRKGGRDWKLDSLKEQASVRESICWHRDPR